MVPPPSVSNSSKVAFSSSQSFCEILSTHLLLLAVLGADLLFFMGYRETIIKIKIPQFCSAPLRDRRISRETEALQQRRYGFAVLHEYFESFLPIILTLKLSQSMTTPSIFDVSKLSDSSLRKYHSYFGLNTTDDNLKDQVKNHFDNVLKVENNDVIDRYLELKREDKQKKGGRQRTARFNN